jgi:hydrogenase/urease accessory protein HupE
MASPSTFDRLTMIASFVQGFSFATKLLHLSEYRGYGLVLSS